MSCKRRVARWVGMGLCLVCLPALLIAAERKAGSVTARGKVAAPADDSAVVQDDEADVAAVPVEMFAAMKAGDIEVKFIPKDDREARVLIKNNSKQPLTVRLPDAFAGVPVLAQRAGGGMQNGMGGGMMNQGMGGGMGGMGGGGMGMGGGGMGGGMGGGGGGGFFNIAAEKGHTMKVAAEKVSQFKVGLVCLEHGKRNPTPKVPYEIRPIDTFTGKPGVADLLIMFGKGQVDQRSAQAAAWHLNNGMSWQTLAAKRIEQLNGDSEPYFSSDQIATGMRVAEVAIAAAQERGTASPVQTGSPGEQTGAKSK